MRLIPALCQNNRYLIHGRMLRMRLGNQLRRLREAAGISPEEAGFEIRGSRSKISRLENGRVKLKNRDVTDLLLLYGVTDDAVLSKFLALVMQSNGPDWWGEYGDILPGWLETYLGLEAAATIIRTCQTSARDSPGHPVRQRRLCERERIVHRAAVRGAGPA